MTEFNNGYNVMNPAVAARGGGIGRMIVAIATSAVGSFFLLYNVYILVYYIGMVF